MKLEGRALTHRFGADANVLDDVNLQLSPGDCVALIGPNGAGKTTLLRLLAGLQEPTHGAVTLDGEPISSWSRVEVARRISVVPQARPPAFSFTALEFVLMGLHAHAGRFTLDGERERATAHAALETMAVGHFAARPMTQLSGGEAQRVVMARTIASGAPVWLLDEPTSNLDLGHQIALLDAVHHHCDSGGTALSIVHDPNLVTRWFDRVVVLCEGNIVANGPPRQNLTAEVFQQAFGLAMRFLGDETHGAWVPDLDPVARRAVQPSGSTEDAR